MGAVYIGEHTLLGRKAAIKVLLPELSAHKEIVQRFFNEAKAVTQIVDPGIVQVFDFGYDQFGSAYIVMELLEGEPMDRRLQRIGRFPPADCFRLVKQICTSLHAAHAKGIVHRDLKPENFYIVGDPAVTGGERAKILDFGIAKLSVDEPGKMKTRTGLVMGTPVYMSPEQCRGAGDVDHRSDVYAVGCVMMTMVTGSPPFEGAGSGELIVAHVTQAPPLASSRVPGLPPIVDDIVQRCLAKDPNHRFQSMLELVAALGQAEQAVGGLASIQSHPGYAPQLGSYGGQATPGSYPGYATPGYVASASPALPSQPTTLSSATGQTAHPPRGSRTGLIVAAAGVLVAATAAIIFVATRSKDEATPTSAAQTTPARDDASLASTTPDSSVASAVVDAVAAEPAVVAVSVDAGVTATEAPERTQPDHGATTQAIRTSTGKRGRLRITAFPALTVYVDRKKMHDTPFDEPLPAGKHTVRLVNRDTGHDETFTVVVKENQTATFSRD